jgi:hypothetical protein
VGKQVERMPYQGESASDRLAYEKYLDEVKRGKGPMQLMAAKAATTPQIRGAWSPRSFTAVHTPQGIFDDVSVISLTIFTSMGRSTARLPS